MSLDVAELQRVLGDELRRERKRRGWTRKDLNDRLDQMARSLQTLATYELGTRSLSVPHLFEICEALGVLPHVLLGRVHDRVYGIDKATGGITIELRSLIRSRRPAIEPLRGWAAQVLDEDPNRTSKFLDPMALGPMADLCGLSIQDLTDALRALPGSQIHS